MEYKSLPDVAGQKESTRKLTGLAWVGMEKIQAPILYEGQLLSAEVNAQVNLKAGTSRGIHMSRLYNLLSENLSTQSFSWAQLEKLATDFISSQGEISDAAKLKIKFQLPLIRRALKSELKGWRLYPVEIEIIKTQDQVQKSLSVEILYSSTCPASTALSLELWRQDMKSTFTNEKNLTLDHIDSWMASHKGMPGTPHAQRSLAQVQVQLSASENNFGPEELIDGLEAALQTPVQTAVKRVDEQEFARLNGQNTMFCEDAARKVQEWLDSLIIVEAYKGTFEHQESLHPHNAVAVIEKI